MNLYNSPILNESSVRSMLNSIFMDTSGRGSRESSIREAYIAGIDTIDTTEQQIL